MNEQLKKVFKKIIPESLIIRPADISNNIKINRAKKAFKNATVSPAYISEQQLPELQKLFPPRIAYKYDDETLLQRGMERVDKLLPLITDKTIVNYLELGCWDGMVSYVLKQKGKNATAVDARDIGFDKRAINEGVKLLKMDAADLKFADNSFDAVLSYDAFEHFENPDAVLKEALRVVRKGGYVYLEFGPLYLSPFGLHIYKDITIPYCQFLFTKPVMDNFLASQGKPPVDYTHCNEWTLLQFRNMFKKYANNFETIIYREIPNYAHLDFVEKYPSCFKSKTDCFENLTVAAINVLLKKK